MTTPLDKYKDQINRRSDSSRRKTETELKRIYERIAKGLLQQMATIYAKYETNGTLTYAEISKYNRLATLEKDIIGQLNGLSKDTKRSIMSLLQGHYEESYYFMAWAIEKESISRLAYSAVPIQVINAAIDNPITGLTLNETLEVHRTQIIANIRREITQGLIRGDTYKTMTARISEVFNGDYKKAVRVVRTEGHRVQEAAELDAVGRAHAQGVRMSKTWRSLHDIAVRHTRKADHRKLDGQTVAADEKFKLGGGKEGVCPGNTGYKEHDINCRCFTTYAIEEIEKKDVPELANLTFDQWKKERLRA